MIGRISRFMTRFVSRWLPDPLIFAMLLTLLTFVIALWLTPQTPISMVKMWGDGFWNLLAFGMQMALIIVTGHALASSAPVKSLLRTAASAAKTPVQGVMLVTFFGSVACVINWGFGLVVGAMFAREVARRVPGSDYPLLIACAYIGFLTWGGGFSGSMPLLAATPGTFPVMTFFSSALINFAVPSGGGHWVIQGPFVIPAAQALGADLGKSVMAIAYGEQWMNMAQPFWALPALAIAGLGVRDIMGYCITALLFSGVIFVIGLTLF